MELELEPEEETDEKLIRYLSLISLGEAKREPDSSLFGYATESQLREMFLNIGVWETLEGSRADISYSAVEYLFNTPARTEGGLPSGIESLIQALCDRAESYGNLQTALQRLNEQLAKRYLYIIPDENGQIVFHYGCIYDSDNELRTEADGQIRELERSLRALIKKRLERKFGNSWEKFSGVTNERLQKWREKRSERDNELIDYSDFYDLVTIVDKCWDEFKECFKNKRRTEVFLEDLNSFRNSLKHSRQDLGREQLMLCIGMTSDLIGKIRCSLRSR